MVDETERYNTFKGRDEDYPGKPQEGDAATEPMTEDEISVEYALMHAADSLVLQSNGEVVVDNEFVFPLDNTWVSLLIWRPRAVGERLKGFYEGRIFHAWTGDDNAIADEFHIVRVAGVSRMIPAWSAISKGFESIEDGTEVLLIYAGLIPLKSGRTYHRILIGSNPKSAGDPLL